ncbi:MAG: hypothetical protein RLZ62_386 [Bacteroidota bacterium]
MGIRYQVIVLLLLAAGATIYVNLFTRIRDSGVIKVMPAVNTMCCKSQKARIINTLPKSSEPSGPGIGWHMREERQCKYQPELSMPGEIIGGCS